MYSPLFLFIFILIFILLFIFILISNYVYNVFSGDLRTTDSIEELAQSLHLDQVPKSWALKSYPSLRPLGSWLNDLQCRIQQLSDWISCPGEVLFVTWISGLFNPQSFLTGINTTISLALAVALS